MLVRDRIHHILVLMGRFASFDTVTRDWSAATATTLMVVDGRNLHTLHQKSERAQGRRRRRLRPVRLWVRAGPFGRAV